MMLKMTSNYGVVLPAFVALTLLACEDSHTPSGMMAGEITAGENTAGEITAGAITAGAITAGENTAGEITAGEITAGEITAGESTAGEITAGESTAGEMIVGGMIAGEHPNSEDPWLDESRILAEEGQLSLRPKEQRLGDAVEGWDYLRYGGYIGTGIPAEIFNRLGFEISDGNLLEREGDNAAFARSFNVFDAPNGVRVVGGITCMGCHSSYIDGQIIFGLGNAFSNYTSNRSSTLITAVNALLSRDFGSDSLEAEAFLEYGRGSARVSPFTLAPFKGLNPAFRIEDAAASMRDPETFAWLEEPLFEVPLDGLSSDVPPWWNVKKKAALYYNAMGRGDFPKMLMQTSVVAISDLNQAREIHSHFDDLLAFIYSIEPPHYPQEIDLDLKSRGESLFIDHCSRCHGTYSDDPSEETYPNLLISLDLVGTDPHYARYAHERPSLSRWLNSGWYASDDAEGGDILNAFPLLGYVAPPLDGIWATAPYLHNGSIPTLAALLDSSIRPRRWSRDFASSAYDYTSVGWPYTVPAEGEQIGDPEVYDTGVMGYSAQGHLFADHLTDDERMAILEYLKSL